jgi:XTP/dITP diphosphohydrolase
MDGEEYLFEGIVRGDIATEEHGEGGFGYDPLFFPEGGAKTFAEMSAEAKNEISHRGRAVRKLAEFLQNISQ